MNHLPEYAHPERDLFWEIIFSGSTLNFWSVKCHYVISR